MARMIAAIKVDETVWRLCDCGQSGGGMDQRMSAEIIELLGAPRIAER